MFSLKWERTNRLRLARAGAVAACAFSSAGGAAVAADCGSLAGRTFGDATTTAATSVTPPSSVLGKDPPTPVAINAPLLPRTGDDQAVPDSRYHV